MGITAISGPHITYGITMSTSGQVNEYNEERAPDLSDLGYGLLDPRPAYNYRPGSAVGTDIMGFYRGEANVDYAPFAASSQLFMTSSATGQPVTGTALSINTSQSANGNIPTTIIAPETGQAVSVFAIDSTAATLSFGTGGGTVNIWNPAAGTGRILRAAAVTSGITSVTFSGRDMYGYKMSETLTSTSSDATNVFWTGRKAFKYLSAVYVSTAAAGGAASTGIGVGTLDIFGLPLLCTYNGITNIRYGMSAGTSVVANQSVVNITLGATATATATTSDVRGTYASSTASNGTLRIQMWQPITANMAASVTAASSDVSAIFGVTQFSSF